MTTMRTILTALALGITVSASAQFVSSSANGSSRNAVSYDNSSEKTNYTRLYAEYNPITFAIDVKGASDVDLTGFSFGVLHGIAVSQSIPLFVEVGGRLTYAFDSDNTDVVDLGDDGTIKLNYLGMTVPVNLVYNFSIPNSQVSIAPMFGLTLRANIVAKAKAEVEYEDCSGYHCTTKTESKTFDFFDKDDVGKDWQFSRVQLGWQIGANVNINKFSLGLRYGSEFDDIAKKMSTKQWALQVGVNF